MEVSSLVTLTSLIMFKGSLGLENQFNGLANEIWKKGENFDSE